MTSDLATRRLTLSEKRICKQGVRGSSLCDDVRMPLQVEAISRPELPGPAVREPHRVINHTIHRAAAGVTSAIRAVFLLSCLSR